MDALPVRHSKTTEKMQESGFSVYDSRGHIPESGQDQE